MFSKNGFHSRLFLGPMFSRKSGALIDEVIDIQQYNSRHDTNVSYRVFMPSANTRDNVLRSRDYEKAGEKVEYPVMKIDHISDLISSLEENPVDAVILDEAFMFSESLVPLFEYAQDNELYLSVASLNKSFRSEIFPTIKELLSHVGDDHLVTDVYMLSAKCSINDCSRKADYSQKLYNNEPVSFLTPELVPEGELGYSYEPRCNEHFNRVDGNSYKTLKEIISNRVDRERFISSNSVDGIRDFIRDKA